MGTAQNVGISGSRPTRTLGGRAEEKVEAQPESPCREEYRPGAGPSTEPESTGGNVRGVVVRDKASTHVRGQCRWVPSIAHPCPQLKE